MDIKYYKTCDTLPIYNFYKILDGDFRYLVKGWNDLDDDDIKVTQESNQVFNLIIQEYSELTSNKEIIVSLNLQILISELEFERDVLKTTLDIFNENEDFAVLVILSEFGFDIKKGDDLDYEFKKVIKRIKGLNNKIRVQKVKYTNRFKKENDDIKHNLDKEALLLEINLKLGREINTRKTSVSKWVNMIEISKAKNAEIEKISNK